MFVLILLQFGLFINMVLLNPEFYIGRLNATNYYQELRAEIDLGLENLSMITSIPVKVLTDTIKDDAIVELSNHNINEAADFMKYKTDIVENSVDVKTIEYPLNLFIEDYAERNDLELEKTQIEQINDVAADVAGIVSNHTVLFNINAVKNYKEFQRFQSLIFLFYKNWYLTALASILCIAFLAALNTRRFRRVLLWTGSSMIAASLMTIIPTVLALVYRIPYRLNIATIYLNNAVKAFTLGYIQFFLSTGSILCLLGILCLIMYMNLSNQAIKTMKVRSQELID